MNHTLLNTYLGEKVSFFQERIDMLNNIKAEEMGKIVTERNLNLLEFIWKENLVYEFSLAEFKLLLEKCN